MCDQETREHLIKIEGSIALLAKDIAWLKKLIGGFLIILAAFFGFDVTGMV